MKIEQTSNNKTSSHRSYGLLELFLCAGNLMSEMPRPLLQTNGSEANSKQIDASSIKLSDMKSKRLFPVHIMPGRSARIHVAAADSVTSWHNMAYPCSKTSETKKVIDIHWPILTTQWKSDPLCALWFQPSDAKHLSLHPIQEEPFARHTSLSP